MKNYGKELILDLHNCDPRTFGRKNIKKFFWDLCIETKMKQCDFYLHYWDYVGYPTEYEEAPNHLKGTSAIQFISTSNITLHALDVLKTVHINFFSCKDFNVRKAEAICRKFFRGKIVNKQVVKRI